MDIEDTVRAYYDTLRRGGSLPPFFLESPDVVKYGLSERLAGYDAVVEGLREQTRTTEGWTVESRNLVVGERDDHGWFSDQVSLAWTDLDRNVRFEFDTRWSGTLVRVVATDETDGPSPWRFAGMHVSTAQEGL
ncbi:nuclear transport factor 2 family protein [Halomarina litorea]|uniref:nuclear transport factor 2 family protein n=1 Tax=Halomarina litorea TaxID=2961595 RepID=UPI0020C4A1EF|nr:nuclear transport factor 2 family protein [Halomarina sp. BCD28]